MSFKTFSRTIVFCGFFVATAYAQDFNAGPCTKLAAQINHEMQSELGISDDDEFLENNVPEGYKKIPLDQKMKQTCKPYTTKLASTGKPPIKNYYHARTFAHHPGAFLLDGTPYGDVNKPFYVVDFLGCALEKKEGLSYKSYILQDVAGKGCQVVAANASPAKERDGHAKLTYRTCGARAPGRYSDFVGAGDEKILYTCRNGTDNELGVLGCSMFGPGSNYCKGAKLAAMVKRMRKAECPKFEKQHKEQILASQKLCKQEKKYFLWNNDDSGSHDRVSTIESKQAN